MKVSDIVKPSNISEFLRLQVSCLSEELQKIQFLARIEHQQPHKKQHPSIELLVLYEISQTPVIEISFFVTDQIQSALDLFDQTLSGKEMAKQLGVAWVELKKGLALDPVKIPKPWGQEIWYTGIEERGVSQVTSEEGVSPLDWVLAAAPEQTLGKAITPILLKILDPLADEVYGDLYFEMHETKQEVYVVTHIDQQAWPDGAGGIRFGFNQTVRKTFSSDNEFKQAYLAAVKNYRAVREQLDQLLDKKRQEEKVGLNDPVMPEAIKQWQQSVPAELLAREKKLRDEMENFIAIKPLQLGDVVKVPCFTPHSLQHGVRTVEFQTPVYERKILSFAQKVLTQHHWDTESALDQLLLDAPVDTALEVLESRPGLQRELVVQFDDFRVERISLQDKNRFIKTSGKYAVLMVIEGAVEWKGNILRAGNVRLVPSTTELQLIGAEPSAVFLLAEPDL